MRIRFIREVNGTTVTSSPVLPFQSGLTDSEVELLKKNRKLKLEDGTYVIVEEDKIGNLSNEQKSQSY